MIGGLVSALGFSLIDLAAIETNTAGAKLFYSAWMLGIYFTFPGIYCCFAPCTMQSFGPKHYSANYGFVYSMNVRKSVSLEDSCHNYFTPNSRLLIPLCFFSLPRCYLNILGTLGCSSSLVQQA